MNRGDWEESIYPNDDDGLDTGAYSDGQGIELTSAGESNADKEHVTQSSDPIRQVPRDVVRGPESRERLPIH